VLLAFRVGPEKALEISFSSFSHPLAADAEILFGRAFSREEVFPF